MRSDRLIARSAMAYHPGCVGGGSLAVRLPPTLYPYKFVIEENNNAITMIYPSIDAGISIQHHGLFNSVSFLASASMIESIPLNV